MERLHVGRRSHRCPIVWPLSNNPPYHQPAEWVWQIVLVVIGVVLAVGPLLALVRQNPPSPRWDRPNRQAALHRILRT
jgi:hypothetical protein